MITISKTKAAFVIEALSIFLVFLGSKSLCFYKLGCNCACVPANLNGLRWNTGISDVFASKSSNASFLILLP